jgi:hypothetical protein
MLGGSPGHSSSHKFDSLLSGRKARTLPIGMHAGPRIDGHRTETGSVMIDVLKMTMSSLCLGGLAVPLPVGLGGGRAS